MLEHWKREINKQLKAKSVIRKKRRRRRSKMWRVAITQWK